MLKTCFPLVVTTAVLAACGGGSGAPSSPAAQTPVAVAPAPAPVTASTPAQRQLTKSFRSLDGVTNVPYLEYLPADYASSGTKTYPLLLFLHGGSGAGTSDGSQISKLLSYPIPAMIAAGNDMCFKSTTGSTECFIVVSPQSPRTTGVWDIDDTAGMLRQAMSTYRVDPKRMYVTGLSMGGGATWALLASTYSDAGQTVSWASKIAAALPIASGAPSTPYNGGICAGIVANHTPIWAFHNSGDPVAALANEQGWVDKVNLASNADGYSCSQAGNPAARLTIYQANTHEGWTTTYDVNTQIASDMNAFQWLLSNAKP